MQPFLTGFIQALRESKMPPGVFNPWSDQDRSYDREGAPDQRRSNLLAYLTPRIPRARFILLAEAVGYQGARFSGIPLTSERILMGEHPDIDPRHVLEEPLVFRRTSLDVHQKKGYTEPTATIVWKRLLTLPVDTYEVLFWNAFPFHPHRESPMNNRTPTQKELEMGREFIHLLHQALPQAQFIALGVKAQSVLRELGIPRQAVRHPANGGAVEFNEGLKGLIGRVG